MQVTTDEEEKTKGSRNKRQESRWKKEVGKRKEGEKDDKKKRREKDGDRKERKKEVERGDRKKSWWSEVEEEEEKREKKERGSVGKI